MSLSSTTSVAESLIGTGLFASSLLIISAGSEAEDMTDLETSVLLLPTTGETSCVARVYCVRRVSNTISRSPRTLIASVSSIFEVLLKVMLLSDGVLKVFIPAILFSVEFLSELFAELFAELFLVFTFVLGGESLLLKVLAEDELALNQAGANLGVEPPKFTICSGVSG